MAAGDFVFGNHLDRAGDRWDPDLRTESIGSICARPLPSVSVDLDFSFGGNRNACRNCVGFHLNAQCRNDGSSTRRRVSRTGFRLANSDRTDSRSNRWTELLSIRCDSKSDSSQLPGKMGFRRSWLETVLIILRSNHWPGRHHSRLLHVVAVTNAGIR